MWKGLCLEKSLLEAESNKLINEILLINNSPNQTPNWFKSHKWNKLKQANFGKNIYVNPAWDIGIRNSINDKICVMSDDINFDSRVYEAVIDNIKEDSGCIGSDFPTSKIKDPIGIRVHQNHEHAGNGFILGTYANLFFLHKKNYLKMPIPRNLLVFFGDDWLYDSHRSMGKIPQSVYNF